MKWHDKFVDERPENLNKIIKRGVDNVRAASYKLIGARFIAVHDCNSLVKGD